MTYTNVMLEDSARTVTDVSSLGGNDPKDAAHIYGTLKVVTGDSEMTLFSVTGKTQEFIDQLREALDRLQGQLNAALEGDDAISKAS